MRLAPRHATPKREAVGLFMLALGLFIRLGYSVNCMDETAPTSRHILVVDDEPLVCDAVKMMLTFDGHVVDTARSGKEALEFFSPGKYDVVFTDMHMPPMNGDELAARIKAQSPGQPVIMITAFTEQLQNVPPAGVDFLIPKPFLLENLRQALAKVVRHK